MVKEPSKKDKAHFIGFLHLLKICNLDKILFLIYYDEAPVLPFPDPADWVGAVGLETLFNRSFMPNLVPDGISQCPTLTVTLVGITTLLCAATTQYDQEHSHTTSYQRSSPGPVYILSESLLSPALGHFGHSQPGPDVGVLVWMQLSSDQGIIKLIR